MLSAGYALAQSGEVGDLRQVFFISEGWMIVGEEGKPPVSPRPSEDPKRMEVLVVSNLSAREKECNDPQILALPQLSCLT